MHAVNIIGVELIEYMVKLCDKLLACFLYVKRIAKFVCLLTNNYYVLCNFRLLAAKIFSANICGELFCQNLLPPKFYIVR